MISPNLATFVIVASLLVSCRAYVVLSRRDGSYVNVLMFSIIVGIPSNYLLPLFYDYVLGTDATTYAFVYVYVTLAVESTAFVYGYARASDGGIRLPFSLSYRNFGMMSGVSLGLAVLMYAPVLLQFREFLLEPREIYNQTRSGFGAQFFLSSTLAYLAVILVLFARCSMFKKACVVLVASGLLLLHGSKGEVLNVLLIVALYHVYVKGRSVGFKKACVVFSLVAACVLLLFAATMPLGDGPEGAIESISRYSDYTRNAMLVIDANLPAQYGRLTFESNVVSLIPRALAPSKPKDFGPFFLAEEFFPDWVDSDTGSPAFGVGLQYADFGFLAIVYVALFSAFKGWLARNFVGRVRAYKHPADFFVLAFLADVGLFPLGVGWFLPESLMVALLVRYFSGAGAGKRYVEPARFRRPLVCGVKPTAVGRV